MTKLTDYVDVFYGNGEIDLPKAEGLSSTWLFLKAQCGNTHPHASIPFGRISCGPYTGGYPTGYGNHKINYGGEIEKFDGKLQGFSHMHQTGTGEILVYYNYAVVSPMYGKIRSIKENIINETATPGYYSAVLEDSKIKSEITVDDNAAYHRYTFDGTGKVLIDFSNDGLDRTLGSRAFSLAEAARISIEGKNTVSAEVMLHGKKLYFYVECIGDIKNVCLFKNYEEIEEKSVNIEKTEERYGCFFEVNDTCLLKISISDESLEQAKNLMVGTRDFESVREGALKQWNEYLSKIEIDADENTKELFYSNFYHSIIKPSKWGEKITDFATLWDLYKTQLPLVHTLYKKESEMVCKNLIEVSDELGAVPMAILQSANKFLGSFAEQAKMLATHTVYDAFLRGICNAEDVIKIALNELGSNPDLEIDALLKEGRYTHIMDLTSACRAAQYAAEAINDKKYIDYFKQIADRWTEAFAESGLMKECKCYEGSSWHYSFRLLPDMKERVELCNGNFVNIADEFFGYGKEAVTQYKDIDTEYNKAIELNRFDGINNEHDMEAPFVYIFADRYDRTCEIVNNIKKYMFTKGRGGIPGNNDTGALSSWYVWNTLGLFPATGQNKILMSIPSVKKATINLNNGNKFNIVTYGSGEKVEKIKYNGNVLSDRYISVSEMMNGGILEFYLI